MNDWFSSFKDNIGKLIILALFILLWQTLQRSAIFFPNEEYAKNQNINTIRKVSPAILKPQDKVLLSSNNTLVQQAIDQSGAKAYHFDANDTTGFETILFEVLDDYCKSDQALDKPLIYFIWTQDHKRTLMELHQAARELNFFFAFQAVLPYQGSDAFAINNFLRLQPKEDLIERYCEVTRLSKTQQVLVIVNADAFSPWIGSVKTGRITWLASDPNRNMEISDFAIKDIPPMANYDVYWMEQLSFIQYWTFTNQDLAAYEQAVRQAKSADSLVFVDRHTKLGVTSEKYLRKCDFEQPSFETKLFRQLCIK